MAGAKVSVANQPDVFVVTNEEGRYELRVPSGMARLLVAAEGYESLSLERKIAVGPIF